MHNSLAYVIAGLLIALSPFIKKLLPQINLPKIHFVNLQNKLTAFIEKNHFAITAALLISLYILQINNLFFASCSIVIAGYLAFNNKHFDWKIFTISLIYLFLSSRILWSLNEENISYEHEKTFWFFVVNICLLKPLLINHNSKKPNNKVVEWISFVLFTAFAAALSFNTYSIIQSHPTFNWSAYIGPAEIMFAGARIFHDFPTQYGLGPTAILYLFHGANPLGVMHYFDSILLFLYALAIFGIAFLVKPKNLNPLQIFFYYTLTFLSIFLWICGGGPLETPSMQGPRLFPATLIALLILLKIEKYKYFQSDIIAHLAWCFAVLWSPESAFYATLIWWPYYLWNHYGTCKIEEIIPVIFKASLTLLGWLFALVSIFLIVYYANYAVMPSLGAFFYYQMHPPGGMSINPLGSIWLFLAILSISIAALYQGLKHSSNKQETHSLFIVLLLFYGTASYFLIGRSHSSNLVNIAPIILILLIATRSAFKTKLGIVPASILIMSFLSYGEFAGIQHWLNSGRFKFGHDNLVKELSYPQTMPFFYKDPELSDLNRAIGFIEKNYNEPISIMDVNLTLLSPLTDKAWSAMHNLSNFLLLSEDYRITFLTNTMNRLQRNGWLLIDKKLEVTQPLLLKHLELVYDHEDRIDFGTYIGERFIAKKPAI